MFEITLHSEQSIPCLIPVGRIDTVNSTVFDKAVQQQTDKGQHLIIDLSRCNYLSSTGIRVLLSAFKRLKAKGGLLIIAGIMPEVFQVFEMAGLHQLFCFAENNTAAASEIYKTKHKESESSNLMFDGQKVQFHHSHKTGTPALLWKDEGIAGYNELGFSIGSGTPADQQLEAINADGLFVATGNCAGFIPYDKTLSPDFRITHNPAQAGILIKQAISFGTSPAGWFRMFKPSASTLGQMAVDIYRNRGQILPGSQGALAFVTANFNAGIPGISFSLIVDGPLKEKQYLNLQGSTQLTNEGLSIIGATFDCEELVQPSENPSIERIMKEVLTLENVLGSRPIDPEELLSYPLVWVFVTEGVDQASAHRIELELPEEGFSEPGKPFLARRLYNDSKRVIIKPLHGGFSAQTFQVASYDNDGRKLRPTVLKIANRAMITREAERCQKYASPYILNNSAQVLGTEFFGDMGALRYNFVGIGGEQTQLKWLTHYFDTWPVEKLLPLFDKTFVQILKPWYGQPVREAIHPFNDHDPTFTFFPHLLDTAEKVFSISCDEPYFTVEQTGQRLVNPYWFLKHEYKRRRETTIDYYTAICHGDLNMQNILLDQDMNVYLIDFSETKPRSVVSDFARLEAIFMVERAPLENDEEMKAMIDFANRLYGIDGLDQFPENSYNGKHPEIVERNVALALKMRDYALKSSLGSKDLAPYYIAMLEWVLPMVCFQSLNQKEKYFSRVVAGLLCKKVMELIPG
jgi:anti-anti-sigma factor